MPQISQLAATYASQIFWLLLTFGLVFFTVGLGFLPKVQANIDSRDARIADDLNAASAARTAADQAEEAWRTRDAVNRDAAQARVAKARAEAAARTEATLAKANAANAERLAAGEAGIRDAGQRALAEIEAVAVEATQDIVAKVAGLKVAAGEANAAVKQAMSHG
ncbi:MAG: ATPase [Pseudomonadota bacterium]